MKRRVIKLGGSLLNQTNLASRVHRWAAGLEPRENFWVVGGGLRVDLIRQRQTADGLSEETCHWAAIKAMEQNAIWFHDLMAKMGPEWPLLDEFNAPSCGLEKIDRGASENFILLPEKGLKELNLPIGWHVTSDSIAASFAVALQTPRSEIELILLKSVEMKGDDVRHWVDQGWVDPYFQVASKGIASIRGDQLPPT